MCLVRFLLSIPLSIFLSVHCFWSDVYCQVTGFICASDVSRWRITIKKVNLLLWTVAPDIRRRIALFKGFHAYPACPSDKMTKKVKRSMEHMILTVSLSLSLSLYIYIYIYVYTHTHTHTHTQFVRRKNTTCFHWKDLSVNPGYSNDRS